MPFPESVSFDIPEAMAKRLKIGSKLSLKLTGTVSAVRKEDDLYNIPPSKGEGEKERKRKVRFSITLSPFKASESGNEFSKMVEDEDDG